MVALSLALFLLVVSLPFWLPARVVGLRTRIFTRLEGAESIAIPGKVFDLSHFRSLYGNPAANGRSRGARLSDLFWYWLAPGPEMHQEHLEAGPRYDEVARTTRHLLALPQDLGTDLATRTASRVLEELVPGGEKTVRLRDLMMPIWAEFYYTVVFREPCPRLARDLIVGNAGDVVSALKLTSLRHMERRHRLTRFLREKLRAGALPDVLASGFSLEERAYYLQGAFFNTAVVQTSEAMAHLLLFIAQHGAVQDRLIASPGDGRYLDHVIHESLRVCPLFGIAHRITTAPITEGETTLPPGSVLTFNYPEFHHAGYERPERFDPDRWETLSPRDQNFMPFGSPTNRPCPAQTVALVTMRAVTREVLRRYRLYSSAGHTRSLPNRGPCRLVARGAGARPGPRRAAMARMRIKDRWEDLGRSLLQLGLGSFMIWDARRLKLCRTHFEGPAPRGKCPFARLFRTTKAGAPQ